MIPFWLALLIGLWPSKPQSQRVAAIQAPVTADPWTIPAKVGAVVIAIGAISLFWLLW